MRLKILNLDSRFEERDIPFSAERFLETHRNSVERVVDSIQNFEKYEEELGGFFTSLGKATGHVLEKTETGFILYLAVVEMKYYEGKVYYDFRFGEAFVYDNGKLILRQKEDDLPDDYCYLRNYMRYIAHAIDTTDWGEEGDKKVLSEIIGNYGEYYACNGLKSLDTHSGSYDYFYEVSMIGMPMKWDLPEMVWNPNPVEQCVFDTHGRYCYIQKDGDDVIFRLFMERRTYDHMFEFMRIKKTANETKIYGNIGLGWRKLERHHIVTADVAKAYLYGTDDGVEETVYKHYQKYCETDKNGDIMCGKMLIAAVFPAFENLLQMEGGEKFYEELIPYSMQRDMGKYLTSAINYSFGVCNDDAGSFAKMVNISQWMADFLLKEDAKTILESRIFAKMKWGIEYEYFIHMDRDTFKEVYACCENEERAVILSDMTRYFGIGGLKQYIKKLYTIEFERDSVMLYDDYLRMAGRLREDYPDITWDIPTDITSLQNKHDEVTYLFEILDDEENTQRYQKKFNRQKKNWKQYAFTGTTMSVVLPKDHHEIIKEGVALHHCVKSYLEPICNGETTILFIRKNDDLGTPFYTLEVRNGAVRQCHGLCNCNVDSDVDAFLEEYCKEKEIEYDNPDEILGA